MREYPVQFRESLGVRFPHSTRRIIFVSSVKAAMRIQESITSFIEKKLKLRVNRAKSKVARSPQVKFLGFNIAANGKVRISNASINRAWEKLKELIPRRTHLTLGQTIDKFNRWYQGWHAYYGITDKRYQLRELESHARRRLRAVLVVQAKRPRTLVKKLLARGISKRIINKIYGKGPWATSHTMALNRGFGNGWFASQGFLELSHWKCHISLIRATVVPSDQH